MLSSTRWDSAWLSKQHLAAAWRGAGHQVLYVDPPVSVLSPLRQPERTRDLFGRSRRTDRGVAVWTPRALPAQNDARAQRWNARLIHRGVRASGFRPEVTVAFGLESRTALATSPGVRIYHCTDSWADHPAADRPTVQEREAQMIAGADVVAACSRPLVADLAERGTLAAYVPHGTDVDAFSRATPDPRLRSLDGPVVGYAGGINFRLDPALIEASIEATDGTFVLIGAAWRSARGAADQRVTRFLTHPRVVTTGHLDGAALASAISALDVGLVPYRESAFNRRSFPLKVPQYLAAGVSVVSTPNGATDEHAAHVAVASGADAFADAVRRASQDDDEDRREDRRRSAGRRPWTVAAAELLEAAGVAPGEPGG